MPKRTPKPKRERRAVPRPFDINHPNHWIEDVVDATECSMPALFLLSLCKSLYHEDALVRFPQQAKLVWPGLRANKTRDGITGGTGPGGIDDLTKDDVLRIIEHTVPQRLCVRADNPQLVRLVEEDGRIKGQPWPRNPAFVAFRYAVGYVPQTPQEEPWVLKFLYDGQHPFAGMSKTLSALVDGNHFTQTAGMVGVHPTINHLWKTCSCIPHTLRARAFALFRYDPDNVFADGDHEFGFVMR